MGAKFSYHEYFEAHYNPNGFSSQGQSLKTIILCLLKQVFIHNQLYVTISRVRIKEGLQLLIHYKDNEKKNVTTNVIFEFKEVFQNLI